VPDIPPPHAMAMRSVIGGHKRVLVSRVVHLK